MLNPFINTYEQKYLLHDAVTCGDRDFVETLIEEGANVNSSDNYGCRPVHHAAEKGHIGILKLLRKGGAQVNVADRWGQTPLHLAVENEHTKIVMLLIKYGAHVNAVNEAGQTLLHIAAENRETKLGIVYHLLAGGADWNVLDKLQHTPLYIAVAHGHIKTADLLKLYGAKE